MWIEVYSRIRQVLSPYGEVAVFRGFGGCWSMMCMHFVVSRKVCGQGIFLCELMFMLVYVSLKHRIRPRLLLYLGKALWKK